MGHEIRYASYDEDVKKTLVQAEWDEVARAAGCKEGVSGLCNDISWKARTPFDSYDDAYNYIEEHHIDGWYEQVAYRYLEYPKMEKTKKMLQLEEKYATLFKKYKDTASRIHYNGVASAYVSCKNCGSKLSTKYLKLNNCPLCMQDLRPQSLLDTLKSMTEKLNELREEIKDETKKQNMKNMKKAKMKWLVKVEYHI